MFLQMCAPGNGDHDCGPSSGASVRRALGSAVMDAGGGGGQVGGDAAPRRARVLDLPFTAVEWVIPADAPSLAPEGVPPAKWALFARSPPPREQSLTGWDPPPPPPCAGSRCLQPPELLHATAAEG